MMTAEQLKGSILQLALQGKLVEQRPEEGTGEDLYKTILAEKKKLIKEGKIQSKNANVITDPSKISFTPILFKIHVQNFSPNIV